MSGAADRTPWDVPPEAVYAERYNESRRFRDYQLQFTKWTISIVLAIAGAYIGLATHSDFNLGTCSRIELIAVVLSLSVGTILVVLHADARFREIVTHMKRVKPQFDDFDPEDKCVRPHHVMTVLIVIIAVIVCILISSYPVRLCSC